MITQYIPDLVQQVASKVDTVFSTRATNPFNVFFDKGHYQEIVQNLDEKDKSINKPLKYPLIWLVMDFPELPTKNLLAECALDLKFIIAVNTQYSYSVDERRDNSFLPYLIPIYNELLNQFSNSSAFFRPTYHNMQVRKWNRHYWGIKNGLGNGDANLFNDWVDAIEIQSLKLEVKKAC